MIRRDGKASERYLFAKTTKSAHPPRLSPRLANKSVDPKMRKASLLPMKATSGFGESVKKAFAQKKQSANNLNQSQEDARLTSKYATFDPNPPTEIDQTVKNSSNLSVKKKGGSVKPSLRGSKLSQSRRSPEIRNIGESTMIPEGQDSGAQTPLSNRKQSMLPSINTFY